MGGGGGGGGVGGNYEYIMSGRGTNMGLVIMTASYDYANIS